MRAFKGEASGVHGSELLSVLMRPNGSRPELEESVAQVVTIHTGGGGEVTALVLAPKMAFEIELETFGASWRRPLMGETTKVEVENYDWFEQWDRLMVWRPMEGPPSDRRAEAALLAGLRRRLARIGPRDKPEAVEVLCCEVFGENLHDLHAILNGSGEMQEEVDDVTVGETRSIDLSELAELLARVPGDWRPALQRSAEWKTADWSEDVVFEAAQARRTRRGVKQKTAGFLGLGAAVLLLGGYLLRSSGSAKPPTAELSDNRDLVATCGSGILLCDTGCSGDALWPLTFGSSWPLTFPLAWDIAHRTLRERMPTCQVHCNTEEESAIALEERLLSHFPLQTPFNITMSRENEVEKIRSALSTRSCTGSGSWEAVSRLTHCVCDLAAVGCEVMTKSDQKTHDVALSDLEASMARLAASFADYSGDVYEVKNCTYDCWNLSPEARQTVMANKDATAAYLASLEPSTIRPKRPVPEFSYYPASEDLNILYFD
ncbi:hypothetical protein GNI_155040 [Gregarina niphandrodes]|uniref:Uncharacterized protein n=1 Tax=Gregarina niphandrodes TaxID=110365 RepID=A0A023AZ69_GRENI|nr:hypothetical protein GNI_155040 [Gregarina niphandrodes]EZG43967.1 hypothetical protein GNI_155040 [Gregarina niphandrodes]|eukprot:XP_011132869.1 hypothetical protein GNI_155040 [Gregarina niphandrodes]